MFGVQCLGLRFSGWGFGLGDYDIFSIRAFGCWHFGISVLSWDLSFHKSTHLTCALKTCELQKRKTSLG